MKRYEGLFILNTAGKEEGIKELMDKISAEITALGADKSVVAALGETIKNIDEATHSLASASRERLEAVALHDKQYDALRKAQAEFVAASAPAMMDVQSQLNAILGSADPSPDDATQAARTVEQLGNVGSKWGTGSRQELAASNSGQRLDQRRDRLRRRIQRAQRSGVRLPCSRRWPG